MKLFRCLARFAVLALSVSARAEPEADFGELIFEDDFERSESQEEKDEPGNDWTTSSDKTAGGRKQVDLRDGAMHMHPAKGLLRLLVPGDAWVDDVKIWREK